MNKKVSIIMPTYNDEKSICETLDTIINQTYKNFELIIVDDGSADSTKKIIEKYIKENDRENKITYLYQSNQDQLNAIITGLDYVNGDYIYIAHSDDLLNGNDILQKCVNYMNKNPHLDAIISDLIIIDENGFIKGKQKTRKYINKEYTLPLLGLWLGRNIYVDSAFYRKDVFLSKVKNTYLNWNIPFWLDLESHNKILKVEKVNFPLLKYRISSSNYINNEIGKLNVINGELRALILIMCNYNIIFYKFQYYIFRLLNKLQIRYVPIYTKKIQKNPGKIVEFALKKRFKDAYKNNIFFKSLSDFFYNIQNRTIKIDTELLDIDFLYLGKDMRKFNNDLLNNKLDSIYIFLFKEMQKGFSEILVDNQSDKNKLVIITKFLSIYPFIKITTKGD